MSNKIKYIATAPNGNTTTVTSTRAVKNCHIAINKETGEIRVARWTTNDNPLASASASSCGFSLGYWKGWSRDRKAQAEQNALADAHKAELEALYTFLIVPAIAA
jgi:hypothetical protein